MMMSSALTAHRIPPPFARLGHVQYSAIALHNTIKFVHPRDCLGAISLCNLSNWTSRNTDISRTISRFWLGPGMCQAAFIRQVQPASG